MTTGTGILRRRLPDRRGDDRRAARAGLPGRCPFRPTWHGTPSPPTTRRSRLPGGGRRPRGADLRARRGPSRALVSATRVDLERFLQDGVGLARPPPATSRRRAACFGRSIVNLRYESRDAFLAAIGRPRPRARDAAARAEIRGRRLYRLALDDGKLQPACCPRRSSLWRLVRTVLVRRHDRRLFNCRLRARARGHDLFDLPARTAARCVPPGLPPHPAVPVLYVLLWKWLARDNGLHLHGAAGASPGVALAQLAASTTASTPGSS